MKKKKSRNAIIVRSQVNFKCVVLPSDQTIKNETSWQEWKWMYIFEIHIIWSLETNG